MPTAFDITFDTLTASFITSGSLSHTKASVVPCILKSWSVERRFELVVVAVDRLDFSVFVVFSLSVNRFGVDFPKTSIHASCAWVPASHGARYPIW